MGNNSVMLHIILIRVKNDYVSFFKQRDALCKIYVLVIPHYIIYNKNDWLISMGYIVS